jgi:hypothetical protein
MGIVCYRIIIITSSTFLPVTSLPPSVTPTTGPAASAASLAPGIPSRAIRHVPASASTAAPHTLGEMDTPAAADSRGTKTAVSWTRKPALVALVRVRPIACRLVPRKLYCGCTGWAQWQEALQTVVDN